MAEVIPGMSAGLGQMSGIVSVATKVIGYIALFLVTGGAVFGIFWILNEKILKFKIPVVLKFEEGGGITIKKDKIWIKRSGDKWKVAFQKNHKLIAQIPDDKCALRMGGKKGFEGYVRNNQVAWCWPQPQTEIVVPAHMEITEDGKETEVQEQKINLFQIVPVNMVESYIHQLSQNKEALMKKKWYQDPVALQWGAMVLFFVAVIFIYLMCKNIPDLVNNYLAFARTIAQGCEAVQIK
jgi:hypothetical protein